MSSSSKQLRIAIYHNLPSGGAKRALCEMTRRLALRHEIEVYTLSSADHDFADLRPYVRNHHITPFQPLRLFDSPFGRLNQLQRRRDLGRLEMVNRRIAAEIDESQYDVVMAHPCCFTQAPSVLLYLQTPSVYYAQEGLRRLYEPALTGAGAAAAGFRAGLDCIDPLIPLYDRALMRTDRRSIQAATRVLVNSRFTQENISQAYGIEADIAYLGVDATFFRPGSGGKGEFLLSVGALRPNKGFAFLIEAVSLLPPAIRPPLRIVANAGDVVEQAHLEDLAISLDVELQIEVGVSDDALLDRYQQARVVVYAPYREPFGFVPLEAMACAVPVVAIAEGGVMETVRHQETGLLVERDAAQFANAVQELLLNDQMRDRFGKQGRNVVEEHWSWERSVTGLGEHLTLASRLTERRMA